MKTEYPSAVDAWLAMILVGAPLVVMGAGVFALSKSIAGGTIVVFTGLVVGGVIAALSVPCVYTLTDESLKIKCGLWEEDVPLWRIRGAEKSRSAWSAPALSLRRVKIILEKAVRIGLFHREPERARRLVRPWLKPGGRIIAVYDEP